MNNFQKKIDEMVSRVLNEEIEKKVTKITNSLREGEWNEINMDEDSHDEEGELEEYYYYPGDYEGDEDAENKAEDLSNQEPTYVGMGLGSNKWHTSRKPKMLGSFDDEHGWYDDFDHQVSPEVISDYDEYTFDEFDGLMDFMDKGGHENRWFDRKSGKMFFDKYKENLGKPFRVRVPKSLEEQEVDEWFYYDDEDLENQPSEEPTNSGRNLDLRKPKMIGSFDDEHGWYDESDSPYEGSFDFDYDEEEFSDFDSLMSKYGKEQRWFNPHYGKTFFDRYQQEFGGKPFRVRKMKDLDEEAETEEGNAFSGALAKAKKEGDKSFEVDGKTYPVKEEKKEKKWIQKTGMKKGALHKKLGVPEGDKIPKSKLKSLKSELSKKTKEKKKLSPEESKLLKQVNLAMTLKGLNEQKSKLYLTEDELIEMIEKMVLEQKKIEGKETKANISVKNPEGLKKTIKVQGESKKENDGYAKEVVEKLKKYLKNGSVKEYDENPEGFPDSNYGLDDMKEKTKKYHPSDAVEEYLENFAYPGLENTKYDEIKPNDEWLEDNLVGSSRTGNNPEWANSVKTEVGEKANNKRKKNAYQAEKQKSYNRVTQPVDEAGEGEGQKSLDDMFAKLESRENKKLKVVTEELEKMKNLISYNRKTQ